MLREKHQTAGDYRLRINKSLIVSFDIYIHYVGHLNPTRLANNHHGYVLAQAHDSRHRSRVRPAAFAQPATGADPAAAEGTTLNQVIEQTLLSNPEIQAKYHDFQSSLEGQSVARAAFFPQVNAQGYVGREYRNNVPGVGSQQWSRPGYNLELRQLIFDGFRTSNDVKQAGFDKLARFYDVLATSDATALAATQAYIDLQRYRDMELLARQNYSLHEETLKQIGQRAESGVGRRVDLEQAGGRLALAQTNLMTETANLLDVQQRFQRVTGALPPKRCSRCPTSTPSCPPSLATSTTAAPQPQLPVQAGWPAGRRSRHRLGQGRVFAEVRVRGLHRPQPERSDPGKPPHQQHQRPADDVL